MDVFIFINVKIITFFIFMCVSLFFVNFGGKSLNLGLDTRSVLGLVFNLISKLTLFWVAKWLLYLQFIIVCQQQWGHIEEVELYYRWTFNIIRLISNYYAYTNYIRDKLRAKLLHHHNRLNLLQFYIII